MVEASKVLSPRRLPVFLLTGFLGSGKTSFLQNVLSAPEFPRERTVVIVNDFGVVNVDAALLSTKIQRLTAMTAGCICCASAPELGRNLLALADDPAVDQVWIEASGVAETDDLLDRLTDPRLLRRITIARVIHLVDASAYPGWWTNRPLAREQLRWADLVVVNKIDRAKPKILEKITQDLAEYNAKATRFDAVRGVVPLATVLGGGSAVPHHRVQRTDAAPPHPQPTTTLFLPLERPVSRRDLEARLAGAPGEVYRAKGFLYFDDDPAQLCVFQKAGEQAESIIWKTTEAKAEANEAPFPRGLVLLGRALNAEQIGAYFEPLGAGRPI